MNIVGKWYNHYKLTTYELVFPLFSNSTLVEVYMMLPFKKYSALATFISQEH